MDKGKIEINWKKKSEAWICKIKPKFSRIYKLETVYLLTNKMRPLKNIQFYPGSQNNDE